MLRSTYNVLTVVRIRIHTATDTRDEGADILILARTDARGVLGMDEAIARCLDFKQAGADIIFLEVHCLQKSVNTRAF
jgi:2-methylisocitrate lyase-like PEP mutase family enzyme